MTTQIVVANRSGLAVGPDGAKYRLVRGRTHADARHPLAQAHPDLFSPYAIELPYEGDEAPEGSETLDDLRGSLDSVKQVTEGYRAQLAAIADGLHERGLVQADLDMTVEGWLAELVFAIIDRQQTGAAPTPAPELPTPPRKRAARRPAPARQAGESDATE